MNDLIKSIVKIVIPIVILTIVADKILFYTLNVVSDSVLSGQSIGKLNQYLTIKDSLDILIVGNSRANHHIDPAKMAGDNFNMGMDASSIAYYSTIIQLLPKKKSQIVLLHLDTNDIFNKNYSGKDISALASKYHRNDVIEKEVDYVSLLGPLQKILWSSDYNGKILGILKNSFYSKYDHHNYNGYDPLNVSRTQKEIFKKILAKNETQKCVENSTANKLSIHYLKEIKKFCADNAKQLIVFTSPRYNEECQKADKQFKKIMQEQDIEYYDFTNFFEHRNSLEYWKDRTHLAKTGAEMFTDYFIQVLEKKHPRISENQ